MYPLPDDLRKSAICSYPESNATLSSHHQLQLCHRIPYHGNRQCSSTNKFDQDTQTMLESGSTPEAFMFRTFGRPRSIFESCRVRRCGIPYDRGVTWPHSAERISQVQGSDTNRCRVVVFVAGGLLCKSEKELEGGKDFVI